ncbi:MAG: hypothetical protein P4N59_17680 [Negativicutes bacterium]|nr:hypothetical protein [Negativicutes bacterium]
MGQGYEDRRLEELLRSYPLLKADTLIEAQGLYNLFPSCIANYSGMPHGSGISDSTGALAVLRAGSSPTQKKVQAIEIAVDCLDGVEKELVRLLYFEKWRVFQVQHRMHISRAVFFRLRRSALDKVAGRLIRLDLATDQAG